MNRLKANLALLLAAAFWGTAFYFQKTAMEHIAPVWFVALRATIASIVLVPLAVWETRRDTPRVPPWLMRVAIAGGLVFLVASIIHQFGVAGTTVTNAGFLTALYVVFTPLLAWAVFGRRPGAYVWAAVVLALAGTWFLGGATFAGFNQGDGLVALSAVFWAGQIVLIGMAASWGRPITLTAIQFVVVAVVGLVIAAATAEIDLASVRAVLPALLFVGVLSSALTYTLFAYGLRYTSAGEGAVLLSMETLFAALAGVLFLGDRLPPVGWLGALLMFAATLVVQLGPLRKAAGPRAP